MYASIIPGPEKPSKEDIYPYIELIVKELLEFWESGVKFSRTFRHLYGCLVKALLLPLVCDMLGARQIIGFGAATSHNFCTFCDLDIDDIDIFDRNQWPLKDPQYMRHIGHIWKVAQNEKQRETIFDTHGIRWSPLFDLPYWNPVHYTVIDPMHIDHNLLQNHCRSLFQIDTKNPGGDGSTRPIPESDNPNSLTSKDHIRSFKKCIELIDANGADLLDELLKHHRKVLYTICTENDIRGANQRLVVGVKWLLANNIVAWKQRRGPNYHIPNAADASQDEEQEQEAEELDSGVNLPTLPAHGQLDLTFISRIIRHLVSTDDQVLTRQKAFTQGTASVFTYICDLLHIHHDDIDKRKRSAKRALFNEIISHIDESIANFEELQSYVPESGPLRDRAVLGKDVMEQVWSDMARSQLPTWITPPPRNWGTTQRGKLSADNWRVICTIHLPITLIRLWQQETGRKRDLLLHFMHLVSAVRISNMRITSTSQISAYNSHMDHYMRNLKKLYPDQNLKPTHHAALHIGDMLSLFGPNHSHNGAHYERYINLFHHINTNSKIGELEATLLNTSARSANLCAYLSDNESMRHAVLEMVSVMDQTNLEDARGFRLASLLDPNSPTFNLCSKSEPSLLENVHHRLLCDALGRSMDDAEFMPKIVSFLTGVSIRGVSYGTSTSSTFRNSPIIFEGRSRTVGGQQKAGITLKIFLYHYIGDDGNETEEIFFLVEELIPVEQHDPYREHAFGGFLCRHANDNLTVISIRQVKSHFVLTKMLDDAFEGLVHVLPVDRLMLEFGVDLEQDAEPIIDE